MQATLNTQLLLVLSILAYISFYITAYLSLFINISEQRINSAIFSVAASITGRCWTRSVKRLFRLKAEEGCQEKTKTTV